MGRAATAKRAYCSNSDTPLLTRIETVGPSPAMMYQLHNHLADMDRLCMEAKRARAECRPYRDPSVQLFDDLIETIERHRDLIAEQLTANTTHGDLQ